MRIKEPNGTIRNLPITAQVCGMRFEWVQLDANDFEQLLSAPDVRFWVEQMACRMCEVRPDA